MAKWTPREIALLGTDTDVVVARKLGRHPRTVSGKRHFLRIPRHGHAWTPEKIALLGTATDGEIAARLGLRPAAVAQKRHRAGIAPYLPRGHHRKAEVRSP